jgi:hypothetical protein
MKLNSIKETFIPILLFSLVIFISLNCSFAEENNNLSENLDNVPSNLTDNNTQMNENLSNDSKDSSSSENSSSVISTKSSDSSYKQFSQKDALKAAFLLKYYVKVHKKLPNSLSVSGYKIKISEFLYILAKTTIFKCLKSNSNITIKSNLNNPNKPTGTSIKGYLSKFNYYTYAKKIVKYIEKYKKAPNYLSTKIGFIQYQSLVYTFSYFLAYVYQFKKTPTKLYLNIKKSSNINKYLPIAVTTSTNSNTKNKNAIWIRGSDMKSVDVNKLVKYGIGNVFLHEYAFERFGKTAVASWIKTAKSKGINVHIWVQAFYDGKWINPINTVTKKYNQDYFNKIIQKVIGYIKVSGVVGIHLDYLRYPGTAYKYQYGSITGLNAITEFTRQLSVYSKKTNPKIILSAAIMPETSANAYYYGQDTKQLGKYLDVIIPMIYEGNYGGGTTWITKTTKWFVANSGGAEIWGGLQTYNGDSKVSALSISTLTKHCIAVLNGGAKGIALFRWGLLKYFDLNAL